MDRLFDQGDLRNFTWFAFKQASFFSGHIENDFICFSQTSLNCCWSCLMRWPVWNPSRFSISPRSVHILNFSATVDICFAAIISFSVLSMNDKF